MRAERRLLQIAIVIACLVPLLAGGAGMVRGVGALAALDGGVNLDSHVRYLSGLLLGIGLAFLSCVPRIERSSEVFRLLGAIVVLGGLARLAGALTQGWPGGAHSFALVMELGVVPALMLWQGRIAKRTASEPVAT